MPRKYAINENTFENIDSEAKAYCLGFLLADGWIQYKGKGVTLAVQHQDMAVIDYLRVCCSSEAPTFVKQGKLNPRPLVGVNLCSMKLVRDLGLLGVVPNKSTTTRLPSLTYELTRHLLRGLFDGDGCITHRQFFLVGSSALLGDVIHVVQTRLGLTLPVGLSNGYPRIWGGRALGQFLHWIYSDCEFALSRKLSKYDTYWKHLGARGSITNPGNLPVGSLS